MNRLKIIWEHIGRRTSLLLLCSLAIRLWLMPFAAQNDAVFIPWMVNWVADGHWQMYTFFYNFRADLAPSSVRIWLSNPPLAYFLMAGWMFLLRGMHLLSIEGWHYTAPVWWRIVYAHRMLFMTKTFYLAFDFGTLWLLWRLLPKHSRPLATAMWGLSPIVWFGSYVMGQTDIIPVFFVTLSLWYARRYFDTGRIRWALLGAVSIGVGASCKLWPLFLIPPWVLLLTNENKKRVTLLSAALLPVVVTISPYLTHPAFREWVLFGHDVGFLGNIPNTWIQNFSPFLAVWGIAVIGAFFWRGERNFRYLWCVLGMILVAFFTLNSFWEFYWLLWLMPFVVLASAEFPNGWLLWTYHSAYYFLYMIGGWNIGLQVFKPFVNVPGLSEQKLVDVVFGEGAAMRHELLSASFSLFTVSLWIMMILSLWQRKKQWLVVDQRNAHVFTAISQIIVTSLYLLLISVVATGGQFGLLMDILQGFASNLAADTSFYILYVLLGGGVGLAMLSRANYLLRHRLRSAQQPG